MGRQEESKDTLRVTGSAPHPQPCPRPAPGQAAPPLQPGHTQVTVVTAPESLGKRVVLNFQLCDLSGEDTQSHGGRGLGWLLALLPCPRPF